MEVSGVENLKNKKFDALLNNFKKEKNFDYRNMFRYAIIFGK